MATEQMATEQTIIEAVACLLEADGVGLRSVYRHRPYIVSGEELPAAFVYIATVKEWRHALGGGPPGGKKYVERVVAVHIHDATAESPEQAHFAYYALIERVRAVLRKDKSLGGLVIRFGEDLDTEYEEPTAENAVIHYRATVTSPAREEIAG